MCCVNFAIAEVTEKNVLTVILFFDLQLCVPFRKHRRATSGTRAAGWPLLLYTHLFSVFLM